MLDVCAFNVGNCLHVVCKAFLPVGFELEMIKEGNVDVVGEGVGGFVFLAGVAELFSCFDMFEGCGDRHFTHPEGPVLEVGIGSEMVRDGAVGDAVGVGLAEETGSHGHAGYGLELVLGHVREDREAAVGDGLVVRDGLKDLKVEGPLEGVKVLDLDLRVSFSCK